MGAYVPTERIATLRRRVRAMRVTQGVAATLALIGGLAVVLGHAWDRLAGWYEVGMLLMGAVLILYFSTLLFLDRPRSRVSQCFYLVGVCGAVVMMVGSAMMMAN